MSDKPKGNEDCKDDKDECDEQGGELTTIAGKTFTPIITSLLQPSAKLIGRELAKSLKEKLEARKANKRAENITGYVTRVRDRLKDQESSSTESATVEQSTAFESWVEGAENVEPGSGPLSEIWEELLLKIALGIEVDHLLLDTLKKMTAKQAKVLLRLQKRLRPDYHPFLGGGRSFQASNNEELFYIRHLVNLGVLEKDYSFAIRRTAFVLVSSIGAGAIYGALISTAAKNFRLIRDLQWPTAIILGIGLAFAVVTQLYSSLPRFRLTWVGQEILRHVPNRDRHSQPVDSDS